MLSLASPRSLTLGYGHAATVTWILQAGELQVPAPDPPPSSPPPNPPQPPPASPPPVEPPIHLPPAPPGAESRELPALTVALRIEEMPQPEVQGELSSVITAFETLANCTQPLTVAVSGQGLSDTPPDEEESAATTTQVTTTTQVVRSCIAEFLHQSNESTGMTTELPLVTVRNA